MNLTCRARTSQATLCREILDLAFDRIRLGVAAAGCIALVEQQVDNAEHGVEAVRQSFGERHFEADSGVIALERPSKGVLRAFRRGTRTR